MNSSTKIAYSVSEAADRLSIGRTLVFRLIKTNELPSIKVGHRRLVSHDALEEFVSRKVEEAA